jgi:hypothetical protein
MILLFGGKKAITQAPLDREKAITEAPLLGEKAICQYG